ncbi:putative RNA-directed DNA polymerase, eukaryota, reverse transcriptase zinc-binding domain protein [Tanacetum coccineum]|uniref:RNA-directed DNA polymerase, eukaryota, reverse transcriptase zinc-binding domain protein n=1 Tax=Tanacetum coccineum TaxID=301880 RepID=A0ABQ5ANU2_9ASTR
MEYVSSTFLSISINGTLHGYFKGERGLRQGDLMSPYLFTLVMEVLTLMLRQRVHDSDTFTYHPNCSHLNIINLCFADDLFLFAHSDVNSARVIMEVLDKFKNTSGLIPSLPKSTAYFSNVLNYIKLDILNVLPFEEGKLPVKYLGVPLVSSRLIYRDCKELVEKVKSKINDWKNKFLSFAGRVQLVQSVLASMHIYWASVFIIPSRILLDLEQLMCGFIWCQGDMRKGRAKVAWESVCLPKTEGGLGLRKLNVFNKALISTHIWSIISLKESLWVKWIHVYKLRGRNFWDLPLSVTPRDIHRAGFNMASKVHDIVTNGSWKWPNEWRLKYPSLYTITVPSLVPNSLDQIVWKTRNDMDSGFSVAIVWDCIRPRRAEIDWYNLVWFSHNIPRHSIHLWLVWHQVQSFTGVPIMPSSLDMIVNLLSPGARKRSARSIIVKLVFAASYYFIWQKRNNRLFKNQKRSEDQLIEVIKSTVHLKLLLCKFKKTKNIEFFLHLWKLLSDHMARGSVYDFGYVLRVECQSRAVLFFPSSRFFSLGFSWEGFLRRQSQMMSYYPSMQFWVGCGDSCSLNWFLPIRVIVSVVEVVVPVVPVEAPVIEEKGDVSKVKKAKKVTKSKPKSPALHPPYFEMIKEAIVSLKERTGSSQYAITKFVEENQKNLPANFKKVLLTQLKKLVAGGEKKEKLLVSLRTVAKKPNAAPKAKAVAKPKAVAKAKPAAKAKPKAAAVKSKAKPKTPTKPAKVAKKAPVAKAIAAKKTPVKKASVKSLKPKAGIAKKVSAGRKAKK